MPDDIVLFQDGLLKGRFNEKDYFQGIYPDGKNTLWRLQNPLKRLVWGPPTEETLYLEGKEGYDNFFDLADELVQKEYALPEVFDSVRACGPRCTIETYTIAEWRKARAELRDRYCRHPDDKGMTYLLASRCVHVGSSGAFFRVFLVGSGRVYAYYLYNSNGNTNSYSYAARPEATLKSTIPIRTDGCDGSKERPWICLGSEAICRKEAARQTVPTSSIKDELQWRIKTGKVLMTKKSQREWFSELEACAKKL